MLRQLKKNFVFYLFGRHNLKKTKKRYKWDNLETYQ